MAPRPMLLLALAALALPAFPCAQATVSGTATVTGSKNPNESPTTISGPECTGADPDGNPVTDNITVHWSFTSGFNTGDSVHLDVSDNSACSTTVNNVHVGHLRLAKDIGSVSASDQWPRTGDSSHNISAGELVSVLAAGGGNVSCTTSSTTIYVCVVTSTGSMLVANVNLTTQPPAAPTNATVDGAGNQTVYASWAAVSGTKISYMIRATPLDTTADPVASGHHDSGRITGTSGQIQGLVNGVTYSVVVYAFDSVDNRSAASNASTGTPVPTEDFWDRYHQAGGVEQGGCSTGSAGILTPLLLLLPLWRRRRS